MWKVFDFIEKLNCGILETWKSNTECSAGLHCSRKKSSLAEKY